MDTALTVFTEHLNAGRVIPAATSDSALPVNRCWGSDANRVLAGRARDFTKPDGTPEKLAFDFVQKCAGNNDIMDVI